MTKDVLDNWFTIELAMQVIFIFSLNGTFHLILIVGVEWVKYNYHVITLHTPFFHKRIILAISIIMSCIYLLQQYVKNIIITVANRIQNTFYKNVFSAGVLSFYIFVFDCVKMPAHMNHLCSPLDSLMKSAYSVYSQPFLHNTMWQTQALQNAIHLNTSQLCKED